MLSEVLDEQLKALWFSPFHTDDMEAELDMVRHLCCLNVCVSFCLSVCV